MCVSYALLFILPLSESSSELSATCGVLLGKFFFFKFEQELESVESLFDVQPLGLRTRVSKMQSQQFSHSLFRVPSSQSSYFKSQQQSVHHTKHQQRSSTNSSYFKQLQGNQQAKKLKGTLVNFKGAPEIRTHLK